MLKLIEGASGQVLPRRLALLLGPRSGTIDHMSWIFGVGVGVAVMVVGVWVWMNRERNLPPNYGTISDQWRSEQRLKERESPDR